MDMLQQIALTKYHLQAHQQDAGTTPLVGMTNQHLGIIATPGIPTVTIGTDTDSVDLNLTHITLDIGVTVAVIFAEVILDHFASHHAIALYATGAPAHTTSTETHHITDSSATVSLLRYPTYKKIEDCYKMPIQPTTAKHNTADGSPMTALGSTALH